MTIDAQSDEVLCAVVPQPAAKFLVMDLQVSERPTHLASPAVSLEDFLAKKAIILRIEFQSGCPLAQFAHGDSQP